MKKKLEGRTVVASVSGGKDSAAMCLYLREQGIPYQAVFMDTGWEHDQTYAYLRGDLEQAIGPITWLKPVRSFEELALHKKMLPTRYRRFCTSDLKIRPLQQHIAKVEDETGFGVVDAVGIRAAESRARGALPEWEWSKDLDCEVWRPILKWTEQEVIDTHRRHGLKPNPLYLAGAKRVGCWPCIMSTKAEIRHLVDTDPERVERIARLETAVNDRARAAAQKKGEDLETVRAFFHRREPGTAAATFVPLDRVVRWAKLPAYTVDLFDDVPEDFGCTRWGMCEAPEGAGSGEGYKPGEQH